MGFLIFAYMKQVTRRAIDRKQFQLTLIANKLTTLQDQISVMQQNQNILKTNWDNYKNLETASATSVFQINQNNLQAQINAANEKGNKDEAEKLSTQLQNNANSTYQDMQRKLAEIALKNQAATSIFEALDKANLESLNRQETQLSSEKESMESQLKILNQQYESYEKGETEEAKKSAPNFGL